MNEFSIWSGRASSLEGFIPALCPPGLTAWDEESFLAIGPERTCIAGLGDLDSLLALPSPLPCSPASLGGFGGGQRTVDACPWLCDCRPEAAPLWSRF